MKKKENVVLITISIIFLVLYPLVNSFLGIDLGDTGIHLYNYDNILAHPENVGFTCFFTNLVGKVWLHFFRFLGIWGLNLLEVLFEWIVSAVVFIMLKDKLGKCTTLVGLIIASICMGGYLNIFNYHQFNVFLLIFMFFFQWKAIESEKLFFSFIAGIFYSMDVFARFGGIVAFVSIIIYIYWNMMNNKKIGDLIKHCLMYFAGFIVMSSFFVLLLKGLGLLEYYINNVFRLGGLASNEQSSYSIQKLYENLITESIETIASGFIFFSSFCVLAIIFSLFRNIKSLKTGEKVIHILFALISLFVSGFMLKYAYDVNPAESWPQMTTGPRFIWGIFLVMTFISFIVFLSKKQHDIVTFNLMGCLLVFLTIVGSNSGTKHIVLGLWILAPCVCYCVKEIWSMFKDIEIQALNALVVSKKSLKTAFFVIIIAFFIKYAHNTIYTCNFDDINRFNLTSYINSDTTKYLKTTEREAESVNEVIEAINQIDDPAPLMVFGSAISLYYITGKESYTKPWVSSTIDNIDLFETQMQEAYEQKGLPIIVYCKTNCYYGFREETYTALRKQEKSTKYKGRKAWLVDFLKANKYKVVAENDYFAVLYTKNYKDKIRYKKLF